MQYTSVEKENSLFPQKAATSRKSIPPLPKKETPPTVQNSVKNEESHENLIKRKLRQRRHRRGRKGGGSKKCSREKRQVGARKRKSAPARSIARAQKENRPENRERASEKAANALRHTYIYKRVEGMSAKTEKSREREKREKKEESTAAAAGFFVQEQQERRGEKRGMETGIRLVCTGRHLHRGVVLSRAQGSLRRASERARESESKRERGSSRASARFLDPGRLRADQPA